MSARAAAAKVSTAGSVRWGPFSLCPRAAGRAVEGAGGGAGAGRGPGRCTAAASLPGPGSSSGPGPRQEGEGRAGTRNRSRREAGRGGRAGATPAAAVFAGVAGPWRNRVVSV